MTAIAKKEKGTHIAVSIGSNKIDNKETENSK